MVLFGLRERFWLIVFFILGLPIAAYVYDCDAVVCLVRLVWMVAGVCGLMLVVAVCFV